MLPSARNNPVSVSVRNGVSMVRNRRVGPVTSINSAKTATETASRFFPVGVPGNFLYRKKRIIVETNEIAKKSHEWLAKRFGIKAETRFDNPPTDSLPGATFHASGFCPKT